MKPLRILMLEDNPVDAFIIQKILSRASPDYDFTIVGNSSDYSKQLNEQHFDLILSDYQLPGFDAIGALNIRNQKDSSIPFILITGAVSEEVAINMVKEGATDYILKDRLQRLPIAVEKAVTKQQLNYDKEHLENSLSELTERFQLAAKTSFDVIWDYDLEKNRVYCSDAIEKIIGIPVQNHFPPHFLKAFIHPQDLLAIERSFLQVLKSAEHRWRKLFRVIRNDGSVAWVNSNAMILRDKNEKAVRVVGVLHDITEVRRLQHELVEQEVQNQRQLAAITVQAQEKERKEIGQELHDNVNQLLATAKIMIDTAKNIPDMHDLCLAKSQESIMEAIKELRNLAHAMMPPPFERNDFESILSDLAYKINLTGHINLQLSVPDKERLVNVSNPVKLAFYRIIQEQVSNILKYASATNVSIALLIDDSYFTLVIEDDGIGFDPQKTSRGIGLKNMESRCLLLGGSLMVVSAPGEGCVIKVSVPVRNGVYVKNFPLQ